MRKQISLILALAGCIIFPFHAASQSAVVKDVLVRGNDRIEDGAILRVIKTRPGDDYEPEQLSSDLEAIYDMGYFDDVRVESEAEEDGRVVIFRVEEKPTIRFIEISGNMIYEDSEIKENIDITTGSILNIFRIKRNIKQIETLYKEKNYHNAEVSYNVEELENNQAKLEFRIKEGEKLKVTEIRFEGNKAFEDDTLKDKMDTSEEWFLSWLTGSGDLDKETLDQDVMKLSNFYHNNGYAEARVAQPEIDYTEDGIHIDIEIDEGMRYKMGEVSLKGDLIFPAEEIKEKLASIDEEHFNRRAVQRDVMKISDLYADEGYAKADVVPETRKRTEPRAIDIVFNIEKKQPVYFEKIIIKGNTKTRDKVIRRELDVYEGMKYSGSELKRSVRDLYRLDYFKDVKVRQQQGSSENQMVLNIQVEEKATGSFSFGGGYSAVDALYIVGSISERNLFGLGQHLELRLQMGGTTQQYDIRFTEPWLFDIPLSLTLQAYNWEWEYDEYTQDSSGGAIRLGYEIFDYTDVYVRYSYDISDLSELDYTTSYLYEGEFTESSLSASMIYDSRDRRFNPTEGSKHRLTMEYAGIGGDVGFTKVTAETGWYFPLFWKTVGFVHAEGGFINRASGKLLPDYERFYLGGIDSLRGFDYRDVTPLDEEGNEIGGDKFIQFNIEYLVPLLDQQGLVGLVFYDTGNAYADGSIDLGNLRESWGYGVRWYSPMGPLRVERGHVIDPRDDEDSSRWEFSLGGSF